MSSSTLPVGIAAAKLTTDQQAMLKALVAEYANRLRRELAEQDLAKIQAAGWDKVYFAWEGSTEPGQGHYYRIQGPTFLVEYDNTQNNANHIHTVWRDPASDFGEDLLKNGVTTTQRVDALRTQVDVLKGQIATLAAQTEVVAQQAKEGVVLSPVAGRVLDVPLTRGAVLMPGEVVAVIGGGGTFLRIAVPERHHRLLEGRERFGEHLGRDTERARERARQGADTLGPQQRGIDGEGHQRPFELALPRSTLGFVEPAPRRRQPRRRKRQEQLVQLVRPQCHSGGT